MDVIAHQGFADESVGNALSTLVAATERSDMIEFDVRTSSDGVPVVIHDERVDRLTDATGAVDGFTADELTSLALSGTDETIPRLATVLDRLDGPLNAELKVRDGVGAAVDLLTDYDDRVLVSSFRRDALDAVPATLDRAVLFAPAAGEDRPPETLGSLAEAVEFAERLDAAAIHPHVAVCDEATVAELHSAGLTVNAWTVRSRETAAAMREAGVDGVITDSPGYVGEG